MDMRGCLSTDYRAFKFAGIQLLSHVPREREDVLESNFKVFFFFFSSFRIEIGVKINLFFW